MAIDITVKPQEKVQPSAADVSSELLDDKAQWLEWDRGFRHWRNQIFIVFWITYGAFYLCRVNFSVAIPDLTKEFG